MPMLKNAIAQEISALGCFGMREPATASGPSKPVRSMANSKPKVNQFWKDFRNSLLAEFVVLCQIKLDTSESHLPKASDLFSRSPLALASLTSRLIVLTLPANRLKPAGQKPLFSYSLTMAAASSAPFSEQAS